MHQLHVLQSDDPIPNPIPNPAQIQSNNAVVILAKKTNLSETDKV